MQELVGYMGQHHGQGESTRVSASEPARDPEPRWGYRPDTDSAFLSQWGMFTPLRHFSADGNRYQRTGTRVLVRLNHCCFVSHILAREKQF